jgi:hypothetical protein
MNDLSPVSGSSGSSGRKFGLRRGLSLLPAASGAYRIGRGEQSVILTTAFHRTAVIAIAQGHDPFLNVSSSHHHHIEQLIRSLAAAELLTHGRREIALPPRYLNEIVERDLAAQQLRIRCEPELLQCEWSDAAHLLGEDEGAEILAARANLRVQISGRNRVATLLHSLLLASGVSLVECIDRFDRASIDDSDIGISTITAKEYAENFYGHLQSHRRAISLFPLDRSASYFHGSKDLKERGDLKEKSVSTKQAALIIHSGPVDIEDLVDWLTAGQAHFVIQSPIADEITMGPLVLPGISPCLRCADLNQIDRVGYSSADRISLTDTPEISMVGAHFIASLAASQILNFIDSTRLTSSSSMKSWPIARTTTLNLQKLYQPQIHSITQHPLCGCQVFRDKSSG